MECLFVLALLLGQASSDEALKLDVEQALVAAGLMGGASSVTVSVRDGTVILAGEVESVREKLVAIEAAFTVPAVEAVETDFRFRRAVTPDVEEAIWFRLMREGVDESVQRILVEDEVARVELAEGARAERERLAVLVAEVPGVRSVDFGQEAAAAKTASVSEPEPKSRAEPPPGPEPAMPPEVDPASEPEPSPAPEPVPQPEPVLEPEPVPEPEPSPMPGTDVVPREESDRLAHAIIQQIVTAPEFTVFDHVQFSIEREGLVRLVGAVTDESKKEAIEERVAAVPGVPGVVNEIRVLREASGDASLRKRLFERIYGDPTFARFADLPNPPVHIIVEAASVTLTGVVDRAIDAMVAEALVRNTFGVRRIDNRLRARSP